MTKLNKLLPRAIYLNFQSTLRFMFRVDVRMMSVNNRDDII